MRNSWEVVVVVVTARRRVRKRLLRQINGKRLKHDGIVKAFSCLIMCNKTTYTCGPTNSSNFIHVDQFLTTANSLNRTHPPQPHHPGKKHQGPSTRQMFHLYPSKGYGLLQSNQIEESLPLRTFHILDSSVPCSLSL